ncbi:MAG: glycosyltransferase family 2 protein [Acidobacteriota bacterium]
MKVSLVVVCHRSSEVLGECVESFRREAAAAGVTAEVVAVEQSEEQQELRAVAETEVDRLVERPNRGYAAGLNAGGMEASGEVLLLGNPDIVFLPGSLEALVSALGQDFDVTGPLFVWDDEQRVFLPPAENPSPLAELGRSLRRRWRWAWSIGLQRHLERTRRLLSREALDRFGPFDEGYFLYHEETDWLWRAQRAAARIGFVPGARVRHRWGHATRHRDDLSEHEERSRARFFRRHYNRVWQGLVRAAKRDSAEPPYPVSLLAQAEAPPARDVELWLASPFPHLMPALGSVDSAEFPKAFLEFCRERRWFLLAAVRSGRGKWVTAGAWTWRE